MSSPDNQTVQENYMPNIARYMETREGPRPLVQCSVCMDTQLIIPGLQNPTPDNDAENFEEARVLPCQHVIGRPCWESWVHHKLRGSDRVVDPGCPICRQPCFSDREKLVEAYRAARQGIEDDSDSLGEAPMMISDDEDSDSEDDGYPVSAIPVDTSSSDDVDGPGDGGAVVNVHANFVLIQPGTTGIEAILDAILNEAGGRYDVAIPPAGPSTPTPDLDVEMADAADMNVATGDGDGMTLAGLADRDVEMAEAGATDPDVRMRNAVADEPEVENTGVAAAHMGFDMMDES
ncbi:hypothetical protein VTJ83DRAFT_5229 [Remersonia thermophila]|uniref:RING-type domain-containing protein n=1 Tax=Remersonia thermophila TaxID=72144 RepID=A0ABR4DC79_9PEZI